MGGLEKVVLPKGPALSRGRAIAISLRAEELVLSSLWHLFFILLGLAGKSFLQFFITLPGLSANHLKSCEIGRYV